MNRQLRDVISVTDGVSARREALGGGLLTSPTGVDADGGADGGAEGGESLGARIMRLAEIASVLHLSEECLRRGSGSAGWLDGGVGVDDCGEGGSG